MASHAEDLLSCPICFEHFQDPRLLHCGHTFCLKCLNDYHQEAIYNRAQISCPTCRSPTQLPNGQVNSLPKDFRIGQFQDVISQSEDKKKERKTFCVLCKERNDTSEASRLCTDCKRDFCDQCALRHSNVPAFKQHHIITMPTGNMASLRYCSSHGDELLMYNCVTCDQFVCSLCITDTHNACDVHGISESLSQNHEKLNKVLVPLLANEDTLNSHLRDYNITIQKLNETHDAIDRQARVIQEQVQKARQSLQNNLAAYEQEQVAKLLTSLSADGSVDVHSYKQLCTDIHNLTTSNDPWTIAMQTNDLVTKATNVNQSLERLKKTKNSQDPQYMKFTPAPDSVDLGTLSLATIDPKESAAYPGYQVTNTFRPHIIEPQQNPKQNPGSGQDATQMSNNNEYKWSPMFSVNTEGSSIGQVNKPTDVSFMSRDTIAVSDYGNSRIQLFRLTGQPEIRNRGFLQNILAAETQERDQTDQVKVIKHIKSCCLATCHAGKAVEPADGQLNDIIATNYLTNDVIVNRYCAMLLFDCEHEKHKFQFPPQSFDTVATGNGYKTEIVLVDSRRNVLALGKLALETSIWWLKLKATPGIKIHKIRHDVLTVDHGNESRIEGMSYVAIDTENQTIFLADYHGHCVKVFTYDKTKLNSPIIEKTSIGSYGNHDGELKYPCGVAIDTDNKSIFVADSGNHRISAFDYDGAFQGNILAAENGIHSPRGVSYNTTNKLLAVTMFSQGLLSHNSEVVVYEQKTIAENTRKSCVIS